MTRRLTEIEQPRAGIWKRRRVPPKDAGDPVSLAESVLVVSGLLRTALRTVVRDAPLATAVPNVDVVELVLLFSARQSYRPSEIGARLALSASGATRLIERAEARGVVQRRPAVVDDRATAVELTVAGRELVEQIEAAWRPRLGAGSADATAVLTEWAKRLGPVAGVFASAGTSSKWRRRRWTDELDDC